MTPERHQQIQEVFHAALEREPAQQAAYLDEACGGDAELRWEVVSLLAAHREEADFLEKPALEAIMGPRPTAQEASMVGRRIGPYKVLQEIGQGGMGAVYLAVRADEQYHKRVAIKLIRRGMNTDAIVRRFLNERQILAGLDHPNIAKLLDGGTTEEGLPYFVLDYVEGLPIHIYCDCHQLSITERLKVFRTVCAAVQYAHQNLIVHRDIKPSNILVTADGTPKLLDFGIAKLLNPELSGQTIEPTVMPRAMTPEYASPEQVRGETITTATDVYSLGVLLYELVTGHRPYEFKTRTPQAIERVICETEPVKPSTIIQRVEADPKDDGPAPKPRTPASVSQPREGSVEKLRRRLQGDLDNILLRALRKEPSRRYRSVEQFSEDLQRHLEGQPVIARKGTFGYRSRKFILRNKAGVLATMLIVLSLIGGMITTSWQAHRAKQQQIRAEQQELYNRRLLYAAEMNLADQAFEDANFARVLDLLKAQEPTPGREDLRGFEWYYLWRQSHSKLSTLPHAAEVWAVAVSPDGKTLATGSDEDHAATLWDLTTGHKLTTLQGHTGGVFSVAFAPAAAGQRLATASADRTAKLWDLATGRELTTLKGHTDRVASVVFSPDGQRLATGSADRTAKLWDAATGRALTTFSGHTDKVHCVAFSPDGHRLATGSEDCTAKLWDVTTGQELKTLKGHTWHVHSVTFAPDGQRLATGSYDRTAKLWDVATGQERITFKHTGRVFSVAFAPDGQRLAAGGYDSTAKLWDVATGRELATLKGHTSDIRSMAFTPDGRRLVTGSSDQTVKLWDMTIEPDLTTLKGHTDAVISVAFAPDGRSLATGSYDRTAKLWDVATGQALMTLKGHSDRVNAVAYSPDGQRLATASWDGTAKLWDLATGHDLTTFKGHTGWLTFVAFAPDGQRLATASYDGTAKLWDVATGRELTTLKGHSHAIHVATFSPDGRRLVTGSTDHTTRLWDVASGRELTPLKGHTDVVASAFAPTAAI